MSSSRRYMIGAGVILLFHICGVIGINMPAYAPLFEQASWFTILLSFLLILWCDEEADRSRLVIFLAVTFCLGMIIEVIGVHTGIIFGHYYYTPLLGWALAAVPLMIGINWILMTYTTGAAVGLIAAPVGICIIAAAILMTLCDRLLEGFAVRHHLWVWDLGTSPTQNYIAWFVISLVMQTAFHLLIPRTKNKLAVMYVAVLILFLLTDRILALVHAS